MSTVARSFETTAAPSSPSPTTSSDALPRAGKTAAAAAPAAARRFGFLRKNGFALADQVLISGTNFVTAVLTARALDQAEFGVFSVIYAGLLFANIIQSTLVTQAHNVLGATRSGDAYRRYTSATAAQQVVIAALLALLVLPLTITAFARGWPSAPMLLAVIPAIVCWQFQEFVRRVLYTEQRYARAFVNDLIGYGGQTLVLVALYASFKLRGTPFTGATALYALAGACGVAALVGAFQLRRDLVTRVSWSDVKENWHFGKWLTGAELMGWCSSLHMQVWWAALLLGAAASADLRAAMILFGPARVISFFLATVLPTKFARTLSEGGVHALYKRIRLVYLAVIPVVGTYCLLLALFPRAALWVIYGEQYVDGAAASVLALYSLSCFVNYTLMVAAAALTASRQTRQIFIGSAAGCVVALVMSPLLIKTFHANGAILSMIVTSLVVGALYVSAFVRKVRPSLQASDVVLPPATSAVGAAAVEAPAAVIPSAQEEHS